MDVVVGKILNDLRLLKNNKTTISAICQRIFYYIQDYLSGKYSDDDILKISCHVADMIEYNLKKLEKECKLCCSKNSLINLFLLYILNLYITLIFLFCVNLILPNLIIL